MPSYGEILTRLFEVIRPFAKDGRELREETELVADLGLDSAQVMELLLEIEDRFDLSIPINVLPDVRTVADLARLLDQLTGEGQ